MRWLERIGARRLGRRPSAAARTAAVTAGH
jgi:hypothetical protein